MAGESDETVAPSGSDGHPADVALAPRWIPPLFLLLALGLAPWIVWLALHLPSRQVSYHFNLAWGGFDTGLGAALVMTAVTAFQGSKWIDHAATAAAVLLVVDAWFDVVTAPPGVATVQATAEALLVELPLAALCVWIARHAEQTARRCAEILRSVHRQGVGPASGRWAGDP